MKSEDQITSSVNKGGHVAVKTEVDNGGTSNVVKDRDGVVKMEVEAKSDVVKNADNSDTVRATRQSKLTATMMKMTRKITLEVTQGRIF